MQSAGLLVYGMLLLKLSAMACNARRSTGAVSQRVQRSACAFTCACRRELRAPMLCKWLL